MMKHPTLHKLETGLTHQSETPTQPALQQQAGSRHPHLHHQADKKTVAIPKEASRPNKGNILESSPKIQ